MDGFLNWFVGEIKKDIEADFDCVLVIDGPEGSGKSTVGWHCKAIYDGAYNMINAGFSGQDLVDKVDEVLSKSCILTDETILSMFKREAMKDFQITLAKVFSIVRAKNLFFILIIPNYFDLDPHLRTRAKYRIYVETRGRERGYAYLYKNMRNAWTTGRPYLELQCTFMFPDLPEDFKPLYRDFKMRGMGSSLTDLKEDLHQKKEDLRSKETYGRKNTKIERMETYIREYQEKNNGKLPPAKEVAREIHCDIGYVKRNFDCE